MKAIVLFALIYCGLSQGVLANSGGGGGGHEAAPAGKEADKNSKAAVYSKYENELTTNAGKISSAEIKIRELIEEKNKTTDKAKLKEIMHEIKKNMADRKDAIVKYNKGYHFIKYELPDRGIDFNKKYKRFDENAQKVFEDEVNQILSDVLGRLNEKYN